MKKTVFLLAVIFFISGCSGGNSVNVKYREDPVDISQPIFEYQDTSESSFVKGAWYDSSNDYLVINLNGTYYHYCGLPDNVWKDFKSAESYGQKYNQVIKGNFDCRNGGVPEYK